MNILRAALLFFASIFGIATLAAIFDPDAGVIPSIIIFGLFTAGFAYLDYKLRNWIKKRRSRKQGQAPPPLSPSSKASERAPMAAVIPSSKAKLSRKRGQALEWFPVGQMIEFAGYRIRGGTYYGHSSHADEESSTIAFDDAVGRVLEPHILSAGYYPSYHKLLPDEKATYLWWLQELGEGRHVSNLQRGYLFLHFYGFERRVLIEGDTSDANLDAIAYLLRSYGPDNEGTTLITYLSDFLHFAGYRQGHEKYAERWRELIPLHSNQLSEDSLSLILANIFQRGEALPWKIAFQVAKRHELSRNSVVITRSEEHFHSLFRAKFEQLHPDGLRLRTAKRERNIYYNPANGSLRFYQLHHDYGPSSQWQSVPNVLGIKSQFKNLPAIWNECIDELSTFSRVVGRIKPNQNATIAEKIRAHAALPAAIRGDKPHPLAEAFQNLAKECAEVEGCPVIPCSLLATMIGLDERPALTIKQSRSLSELADGLGYHIVPNIDQLGIPLRWSQDIIFIPGKNSLDVNCQHAVGALRLSYLTLMVAAADGDVADDELACFKDTLQKLHFTPQQQREIRLTLEALSRTPLNAIKSLSRIAKSVVSHHRKTVLSHLVDVSMVDDIITGDELRVLKRIAKAMEQEPRVLGNLIDEKSDFKTVAVISSKGPARGEPITPPKPAEKAPPTFSLDQRKIASIAAETESVVAKLSEILSEDKIDTPSPVTQPSESSKGPDWLEDLEEHFRQPLLALIHETSPNYTKLVAIAEQHHLVADSFINEVNEWSDEALGDFLIEHEASGEISIYRELIPAA